MANSLAGVSPVETSKSGVVGCKVPGVGTMMGVMIVIVMVNVAIGANAFSLFS